MPAVVDPLWTALPAISEVALSSADTNRARQGQHRGEQQPRQDLPYRDRGVATATGLFSRSVALAWCDIWSPWVAATRWSWNMQRTGLTRSTRLPGLYVPHSGATASGSHRLPILLTGTLSLPTVARPYGPRSWVVSGFVFDPARDRLRPAGAARSIVEAACCKPVRVDRRIALPTRCGCGPCELRLGNPATAPRSP